MKKILSIVLTVFFTLPLSAQSLKLTTNGSCINAGDLDISGNQLTVEATILMTAPSLGENNIISKHTGPPDVNYLFRPAQFVITTTTQQAYAVTSNYTYELNKWYHIAATYDGTTMKYYVNGCLISQSSASGNLVINDHPTTIGYSIGLNREQFYGNIDEARIWNVARTQAQIQENAVNLPNPTTQTGLKLYYKFSNNYTNLQGNTAFNGTAVGTPTFNAAEMTALPALRPMTEGLVAYYPFTGNAQDASGTANGTVNGATLTSDRFGVSNRAYDFNGQNNYITANGEKLVFDTLTISVWVYPRESQKTWAAILDKSHSPDNVTTGNWVIQQVANEKAFYWGYGSTVRIENSGTQKVNYVVNQWQHFVATKIGGQVKHYLNGKLISAQTYGSAIISKNSSPLNIGNSASWDRFFNGKIDDIRIYNRSLTECEVSDLYESEKPPVRKIDVSGYWQGVAYQGGVPPTYSFTYGMVLTQNDVSVNGISTIITQDRAVNGFAKKVLIGNTNEGALRYTENLILPQSSAGFGWCLVNSTLEMDSTGNKLSGLLEGVCAPGRIEVYRLKLLSDSCASGLTTIRLLGQNLKWYSDSLSNTPVFTGNNYQYNLTRTTTFWITQTYYGFESPKYPITVLFSTSPNCKPTNTPLPDLIAWYSFTGNAKDSSGNNFHGIINGGAVFTTDRLGNPNSALELDGINDVVSVPDNDTLDIGLRDYTLVSWIKTNSTNWGRMVSKGSADCVTGFMMRTGGTNATRSHLENAFQGTCRVNYDGEKIINDNRWHCVVGMVRRDSFTKIYIDGHLDRRIDINTSTYNLSNNLNLLIGASHNTSLPEWFKGSIDEVRIYGKTLNLEELANVCESKPTKTPEIANTEFIIYPNPVSQILTIETVNTEGGIKALEIYNPVGQFVLKPMISTISTNQIVDVSSLSKGFYFVKVYTSKGVGVVKFVKE
jgi:Concanavalin A-like lectin/glucanases superfamily/Secretion system C-terminal sorting domain